MLCAHTQEERMKNSILKTRTYSELCGLTSFEDRFEYLRLKEHIGEKTFGYDRYLNQGLYRSRRWRSTRDAIIVRDNGCDLGSIAYPIFGIIVIHHMNPLSMEDIEEDSEAIFNPEFLITTTVTTHRAIHYGNNNLLEKPIVIRYQGDTCPWR